MPYTKILQQIEEDYANGKLCELEGDVHNFVSQNMDEIFRFQIKEERQLHRHLAIDAAIKMKIVMMYWSYSKSERERINAPHEIQDELKEIEKEKWYQSEQAHHEVDGNRVAVYWNESYGPGFWDVRVLQYVTIVNKNAHKYLELYKTWCENKPQAQLEPLGDVQSLNPPVP
jgi:hypothetical protein